MKFGVITFPGSNCDRDVVYVTRDILKRPTHRIWHGDSDLGDVDVVVVPGGFSFGDYLRCGAVAQFSPAMRSAIDHASKGGLLLGICNGFQILTEVGLLPGALMRNQDMRFICDRTPLKVERTDLTWTKNYTQGQTITIPIAHGEGCYYADENTLNALEDNNQVVFRYSSADGTVNDSCNPNGSLNNIAGICNKKGNVLGMMPHPERAADPRLGGTDGLALFESVLQSVLSVA